MRWNFIWDFQLFLLRSFSFSRILPNDNFSFRFSIVRVKVELKSNFWVEQKVFARSFAHFLSLSFVGLRRVSETKIHQIDG